MNKIVSVFYGKLIVVTRVNSVEFYQNTSKNFTRLFSLTNSGMKV